MHNVRNECLAISCRTHCMNNRIRSLPLQIDSVGDVADLRCEGLTFKIN